MSTYRHDTYYYGGEILNTINKVLECEPIMDRSGKYVWCDSTGEQIVYCDMYENNGRGCLEVYENGRYKKGIDYNGILDINADGNDLVFNKDKIIQFLTPFTK